MSTNLTSNPMFVPADAQSPGLFRLSVEQYEAMSRAGILTDRDRVELVDGLLVNKMTKNPPHSVSARAVAEALASLIPAGLFVTREEPIRLSDRSEPEPDVAIIRGASRDYRERHPGPAHVPLIVEVADWSLAFDRGEKLSAYAVAGIPAYWIVNLNDRRLEVHSEPQGRRYRNVEILSAEQVVHLVIDGQDCGAIPVSELLA